MVLAFVVMYLASAILGGTVFVWCTPMATALLHACCPAEARHEPTIQPPCCEGHHIAALPDFTSGGVPDVTIPPPALVALLALAILYAVTEFSAQSVRPRAHFARAGPRVPLFLRHRSLRN